MATRTKRTSKSKSAGPASVTLRGRFPAGAKVELAERNTDFFNVGSAAVVATATTDSNSETSFEGLPEGGRYWVSAEVDGVVRHAAVTAKVAPPAKQRVARPGTVEARPSQRATGPQEKRPTSAPRNISERVHQRDVPAGVLQRSATPLGMATPKHPDELTPGLPQSEVPKGVVQRSDTPQGEATIKPKGDEAPAVPQEEAKGLQRSDTPTGEEAPKPRRGQGIQADEDRDAEPSQKALRDGAERVSAPRTRKTTTRKSTTRRSRTTKKES